VSVFRIRRIYDHVLPINAEAVRQVQAIIREQFAAVPVVEVEKLPDRLRNPLKSRFRSLLLVADDWRGKVQGFALLMHEPRLGFCYLDFISAGPRLEGRGVGGALYERVREEAGSLQAIGVFFECLPDDPALSRDPEVRRRNASRLRFYERYGARPIIGTRYETPVKPGGDNPPYLVFDDLGRGTPLHREVAREIVRSILEEKYARLCPPAYVEMVVESFSDDPVRLREPRYVKRSTPAITVAGPRSADRRIVLVVNDRHHIHHVHERGYVESPVRIASILRELERVDLFLRVSPRHFRETHILEVHDHGFVAYFKRVCEDLPPGRSIYPYVFPIRNGARQPKELAVRAGYYCIDTFTPLNRNAFLAARRAVDCALTAAEELLHGARLAYALVRPPGHHAERRTFGGFCYFNSTAVAAHYLSALGKVAILDVDYHHGNGQQDIFYARGDVLTISLHGHPRVAYPYFSGFEEERGEGAGLGANVNVPLPEQLAAEEYRKALAAALRKIQQFGPQFLVVAFGLDTAKGDPTGSWNLRADDFEANGRMIGSLALPTLVVQEGGYDNRVIGGNARRFFQGLWVVQNRPTLDVRPIPGAAGGNTPAR
jgi:acetoin utilization deacetylase AcuC-like enzyme/GNAT superfamily N-acetyltransferase